MTNHNFRLCSLIILAIILTSGLFLTGCDRDAGRDRVSGGDDSGSTELKGTIRVSGAWALYPLMIRWGEEFQKIHPDVRIDISAGGAGKGVSDALGGLVDIGMISRDIRPEEIEKGAFFVAVAKDAVFPTMNSDNPAFTDGIQSRGVERNLFIELWVEGKPLTWGDLSGTSSTELIDVYTRSDACGAAETWAGYLGKNQEDLKGIGVYGDPGVAVAIKQDVLGLGYNNLNYAYDPNSGNPIEGLRVIPVDINGNGRVDPEEDLSTKKKAIDAVVAGVYPSPPARDLFLMTKNEFTGITEVFIRWILTDGQKYLDEVGYILIGDEALTRALGKLGE
jgi:phosphate transport system substrate-binding protein